MTDAPYDPDYCELCGHFHDPDAECPEVTPCGDYRCCVPSDAVQLDVDDLDFE